MIRDLQPIDTLYAIGFLVALYGLIRLIRGPLPPKPPADENGEGEL